MLLMQAQENGAVLDEEELLFLAGEQGNTFDADVDNQPVQDLALNEDNIFQADECDAFDSDVDDEPTAQTIFMANLSSAGSANPQAGPSNASILSEVHTLENAIDHSITNQNELEIHNEVQQSNVSDSTNVHMGNNNIIPYEQYLTTNDVSVVPSCASLAPNNAYALIDNNMHTPHEPLVTELATYKEQVAIYEQRAKFELTEREQRMNDQMRVLIQDRNRMEEKLKKELHSVKLQLNHSIKSAQNSFYLKRANVAQPALYDGNELINLDHGPIDIPSSEEDLELAELTRQKMHEKLNDPVCVENGIKCIPPNYSKENFLVTFTPQTQLTLEQVFWSLDLVKRKAEELKAKAPLLPVLPPATVFYIVTDSTLSASHEIVEDAKVERPMDTSIASACRYVKHSQELLEYVIGTYPNDFSPSDKQNASTHSLRNERVTFVEPCETSTHDTPPQVEYQKINSTNASGIPSTGVKGASTASTSKPRSNTKKDRTLPARSALKQVEAHSRMNKSNEKQENSVDSSISSKRTVINSNSNSLCKTCNECLISSNHVKCVERFLKSYNKTPVTQIWRVKQVKQTWKPTGKIFTTIGYHWKPTGRIFPLGDQCPLTRITKPKALPVKQWKPTGRLITLDGQCPLVRPPAPTNCPNPVASNLVVQIVLWYLDSGCSKHMTGDRSRLRNFVKKFIGTVRFGNDHFGAIMGYGDYVIGDSVISRVYYVEGLGHNLFSVDQFCDSDLEVAFRKHTCFVRNLDGVDLIKESRDTNLYTISVDDMMRSSPICLLSKASKNKSWLWHRRLNHLNFGTLNDLARKDLVRGLPRLKFEKDHLCSACQLGKSRKATHKPKTINTISDYFESFS
ncbi:integrase, catalytic region, zinc finger, CCHC-type containing protein [Tanacetum coccineum]